MIRRRPRAFIQMPAIPSQPSRLQAWLQSPPISDPVDRRNAPMLQVLLLLLAALPPLLWLYRIVGTDIAWRPGETVALLTSMSISAVALASLALLRRGRYQWAIRQMLVVAAVMLLASYAGAGLSANTFEQPIQVMWLFVAGVMVGRRALWLMYGVLAVALFLGAATEQRMTGTAHLWGDAAIRAAMFLLVAIVVDRSSAALRTSLDEATRRGQELARLNVRLKEEIAERERTREQLLQAQKVEAVGHMASGVAHDFNHLLALIMGYAGRGRLSRDPDELHEVIGGIESAAQRASAITHKLLNFARYDTTRPVRFDVREALEEMEPMLRQTLGPDIRLEMALPDEPCPILFDRAQFGLAMLNLTANSAQAIPGAGDFGLAVTRRPDDNITIVLRDSGPGIPPEVQERMFEPFFTTKPAGQGTGLGLPIVNNLVKDAGGSMRLESAPGEGTTVAMILPLAPGSATRPAHTPLREPT